ncbi:MAG: uroporphyrinogen-III synthase [Paracoccaceae bacterium]|nr:uroporphyrinogen-III synthase [Paracoccaceae bacterium]MDE3123358.1 uroporphyrinogen-III synthase [Paracoccaceae bacterium]
MSDPAPILLMTRPNAQSARFAEELAEMGLRTDAVISPLLEIVSEPAGIDLRGVAALVFTSANGVRAYLDHSDRRDLPAFCVGGQTAAAAQAGGLRARSAEGDLSDLARLLRGTSGPVLHLHGEHVSGDLAALLGHEGPRVLSRVVYRQIARPLTPEARAALGGARPVLAPVFSRRTAELLRAELPQIHAPLCVVAISPAVSKVFQGLVGVNSLVAARPDHAAMIETVAERLAAGPSA